MFSVFLINLRPKYPGFATLRTFVSIYNLSVAALIRSSEGVRPLVYEFITIPFESGFMSFFLKNILILLWNSGFIGSPSILIYPICTNIFFIFERLPLDPLSDNYKRTFPILFPEIIPASIICSRPSFMKQFRSLS